MPSDYSYPFAYPEGQVESVVESLGIEVEWVKGDELVALCPSPDHYDHTPSWSINVDHGGHHCFSCGYGGTLFELVADLAGEAKARTMNAELEQLGRIAVKSEDRKILRKIRASQVKTRPKVSAPHGVAHEALAQMFTDPPQWALEQRRISAQACAAYGVRWDDGSWILPIRALDSRYTLGWQVKSQTERYFDNFPWHMRKSMGLFLPIVPDFDHRFAVVESPLDCLLFWERGLQAGAICGSRISDAQMYYLGRFPKVLFGLDNDHSGIRESNRVRQVFPRRGVRAEYLDYDGMTGKDPGEFTDAELGHVVEGFA